MSHLKPPRRRRILVVEDNPSEAESLGRLLWTEGWSVSIANGPQAAEQQLDRRFDLILSDLRMGAETGIDLLRTLRERRLYTPFILFTAYGDVDSAVQAMKLGASDFLAKPVDPKQLILTIREMLAEADEADVPGGGGMISDRPGFERVIGRSRIMADACTQTAKVARSNSTVLILGESGSGKELFAEAIHRLSHRADNPLVIVNVAAIPDTLVESELFGHVKGAFTGATADHMGRFEAAHGGTLFIDEIGDFPLHLQAKLLRVLEARAVNPVGSGLERPVDVRVVAATSRPLAEMCAAGTFREDLYYRLNVLRISLPPLRERRQDIPLLVRYFLAEAAKNTNRALHVSSELMRALESFEWPGNVRQLRNCVEWMSVMARGDVLTLTDLPPDLMPVDGEECESQVTRMEELKKSAILDALHQFGGNRTRAAEFLGISVRTLQRRIRQWGD